MSFSKSKMAPSAGRRKDNSVSFFVCLCLVLYFVPYIRGFSLPKKELTVSVSHDAKLGHVVLKEVLNASCIELHHVAKLPQYTLGSPVTVTRAGSLVVKVPLTGRIGDTVVIVPTTVGPLQCSSIARHPQGSFPSPVYVEVKHSKDILHFVHDSYLGTLTEESPAGTAVKDIEDLYACSKSECRNNIDYKIHGSTQFYLQTQLVHGKIVVQISSRERLQRGTYHFIVTATDDHGHSGHTNVQVDIKPTIPLNIVQIYNDDSQIYNDDSLHFVPSGKVRTRRATTEQLNEQSVLETETGTIFSVKQNSQNWEYALLSSTYENAFTVAANGDVAVTTGRKLDYEYLSVKNRSTTVVLIVNVINKDNNEVVKQLEQKINIVDVNDELPVFTNKPVPFYATVTSNSPPNTLVYSLTASDPDKDAQLELTNTDNDGPSYFRIDIVGKTIANIFRTGSQAFIDSQEYRIRFQATDRNATAAQVVAAEVQIKAGTRSPQFFKIDGPIRFPELNAEGQKITPEENPIKVISFQKKAVTFTVLRTQDQPDLFFTRNKDEISQLDNVRACHLYVKRGMDYEQAPRAFNITIRATEAETGFTSTVDARIEVLDVNEYPPRFSVSTYKEEDVWENVTVGTSLLSVTASDQDFNTALTFTVSNPHFRVAPKTVGNTATTQVADIFVNEKLDYDRISPKLYDFSVVAIDNGKILGPLKGEATVRIFMRNLNDEAPVFPTLMTTNVRYDTQKDREIFVVQATDEDNGDVVSYSMTAINPPTTLFTLEGTGRITLRSTIATDQADITTFQYRMTIVATDDGGCCGNTNRLSSTSTLTINIQTDNLYRPVFQTCSSYTPEVMEEVKNAPVITVSATDRDHGIYGDVKYSIRGANSQFRINETTGELFTNETIDREKLVFGTSVTVNVLATDGGNLQGSCSLLVKIQDKNDHAPLFASPDGYAFTVQNSLDINQGVATVSATDKDIGENADITYSLVENDKDLFKFDATSSKTGEIKVAQSLAAEAAGSTIMLKVMAKDNGVPALHTNVSVQITFINNPDIRPPVWSTQSYQTSVLEGTDTNTNILNISATSQNQGDKALSFSIVEKDLRNLFYVQADSGVVNDVQHGVLKTNGLLDYETKRQYTLTLRATDVGSNNMQAEKVVTIDVLDKNDVRPQFVGMDDSGLLILSIDEGNYSSVGGQGKLVGQVSATDADRTSPNNKIERYEITTTQTDFTLVSNISGGFVFTKGDFDRETKSTYSMNVIAVDGDDSSTIHNTVQVSMKVTIADINDNAPYFKQDYVFTAREDLLVGSVVDRVEAFDLDSDAILKYSITSDSSGSVPFTIQQETGDIKVAGALDFDEGIKTFHFKVSVDDSLFSSSTNVTINLIDVNDNPPNVRDYTFLDITENDTSTVGKVLEKITATDIDNGGVNTFYYEIKFTEKKYSKYFQIDRVTGELKIVEKLDRDYPDGLANFVFTVEVSDALSDQNPLVGYGTISVQPIDINDNAPLFPVADRQMAVEENKLTGALVGRVVVVDYDAGDNAKWDLTLLRQTPENAFKLSGQDNIEVITTKELDREKIDKYFVVLQAVDRGDPALTGTGTLTIEVLDVNDNAPFFNTTYKFPLSEAQKTGEFGRIQAYDLDIGVNAQLTYALAESDIKYFKMDQDNNQGVLTIFQAVDYDDLEELQRSFNLTAYAKDIDPGPNNLNRARTTILVEVSDYNDETPKFEIDKKETTVPENQRVGTVLATFNATDRDVDPNYGSFRYFIARKTDPLNQFTINDQGQVSIKNSLDRETNAQHTVNILAIDNINGFPQNTGTATLIVTVTDINDNYPNFADALSPSIMENETLTNRLVVTFSAKDADEPINGPPFFFSLNCSVAGASSQCNKFMLDFQANTKGKETGSLYVTGTFDREFEDVVALPIWMCDVYNEPTRAGDQQCGIRFLNVLVNDKDDELHHDGYQKILVYNYKGLFGDFKIGMVNDNDKDEVVEKDSKEFTLLNAAVAGLFVSIDPKTGAITLKKKVPEMSFEIKVRVTHKKTRVRTSTVRITVVYITEDAVYNSGSVRIDGITPEDFLFRPKRAGATTAYDESMYEQFRNMLADNLYGNHFPASLEKVQVLSVMKAGDSATDVRFAAHGSPWYQSSRMDGIVTKNRADFDGVLDVDGKKGQIGMVPIDMCQQECEGGGCYNELVVGESPVLINTKGTSFVGVQTEVRRQCKCRAKDFSGEIKCEPGYCYHGGTCTQDNWGVVSCNCPAGFDGPRCQQLRQSFDGTGYAMYPALEQCEESRTSLQFLTTKASGVILYNGPTAELSQTAPRDFIVLELVNGYPRLRINQGTGELQLEITGASRKKLNDGSWHTIDIFRKNIKQVSMVVDHCVDSTVTNTAEDRSGCEVSGVTPGEHIFVNTGTLLQLGGRMSTPPYPSNIITDGFEGCMKNLIHNAEIYDLSTGGQFPGAEDGCKQEDNACNPAGCGHGQCLITGRNQGKPLSRCICDAGNRTSTSQKCDTDTTIRDFGDRSFVDWKLKETFKALLNSRMTRVSFHFRTRDTSGVIFSVKDQWNSNKYITFKIIDSRLQVAYNLGDDKYVVPLSNVQASDGQWHKVVMERFGKEFILKLDSGEGRYYAETAGPIGGAVDFISNQDQVHAGGSVVYDSSNSPSYSGAQEDDFQNSCLNDIRLDHGWFPLKDEEEGQSPAATFEVQLNTTLGCTRDDCTTSQCPETFICLPLWGAHECVCEEHYIKTGQKCLPRDYCGLDEPCFGNAVCNINIPPGPNELPYKCVCPVNWYGPQCQCHPSLNPSGTACNIEGEDDETVGLADGALIAIILAILVLIAAIIIIVVWMWRRGKPTEELLEDDLDDDIRENVMYYDEEGAGEEDQTRYDLSRLRKPDDGERPGVWSDAPDIPHKPVMPLGSSDRPDIGDFISGRLDDADDDQGPPFETPTNFNYEGGSSDAGSLSSLNTSSSGDQDYDYLNEWGPKFAKLADMYNNYDSD